MYPFNITVEELITSQGALENLQISICRYLFTYDANGDIRDIEGNLEQEIRIEYD